MGAERNGGIGRYLYAIAPSEICLKDFKSAGIEEGAVYTILGGGVAAVVSDLPRKTLRPERRHLTAHQAVIRRLMEETTVLPVSFGVISESSQAVRKMLSLNRARFVSQLDHVAGKVEMGLRVTRDVPNIFEYMVNAYPELRSARDQWFRSNHEPTVEEKIEVGRIFERILNEDRKILTDRVEEILIPRCSEIKRDPLRDEREVMHLACLIARESQASFEAGVLEAAGFFDHHYSFDYNGPWAPHNFVALDLSV
ncbi:MAG: GvpL/GvpF family gas vesicle protein [Nitrospirae bacterium]|nr:GvpL/GvpF family gas vesicle protein [Nitrospirota bacterium]